MKNFAITGIIPAGGKSSRMGFDKSKALIGDKSLIEHVQSNLEVLCSDLLLISNNPSHSEMGLKCYADLSGTGPLSAIYTGLYYSKTSHNIVCACDSPFVKSEIFEYLLDEIKGYDALIPEVNGRLQPLTAVYKRKCFLNFREHLENGNFKVENAVRNINFKKIRIEETDFDCNAFANINTPADLDTFENGN